MEWIAVAQRELTRLDLPGWLLYDFRGSNPLAKRFLQLGDAMLSRRVFLFVPPEGPATLLVHAIERGSLPPFDGDVRTYDSYESLHDALARIVPRERVALEYSPMADLPYVSYVDAGTMELLRSVGVTPISSAELLQAFSAWTAEQVRAHETAARHVMHAVELGFAFVRDAVRRNENVRETDVQRAITTYFDREGLEYDHPPIIGFGPNSGDPHYAPRAGTDRQLERGDAILMDVFAKLRGDANPYADVTWMGSYGTPTTALADVFGVVRDARDLGVATIRDAYVARRHPEGREVDRAVRDFIDSHGYGANFVHRTGHSLGTQHTHGDAAHLDDFETRDGRPLTPGLAVTIEPGVYRDDFGVRSELNVVLEEAGPRVTTGEQRELEVVEG